MKLKVHLGHGFLHVLHETFEKISISFKFKEGENIALTVAPYGLKTYTSCNHRNTLSISKGAFCKSLEMPNNAIRHAL
jgi:hypothetical protein